MFANNFGLYQLFHSHTHRGFAFIFWFDQLLNMEAVQIYSEVSKRSSSASQGNAASVSHRGAQAFGYSEEELAAIPKGANLGFKLRESYGYRHRLR